MLGKCLFWLFSFGILILIGRVECENSPKNCKDVLKNGGTTTGLYTIQTLKGPRQVFCDQDTGDGGWTTIQQRFNARTNFWNRTWEEYKQGFGKVDFIQNFYMGNDFISELTHQYNENMSLRIETYGDRNPGSPHEKDYYFAEYYFKLGDESTEYTATIFVDWFNLTGNASFGWYDITYSNGVKFSTIDHINDPDPDCQKKFHLGGWWTNYCGLASLNGEYNTERLGDGYGLFFVVEGQFVINPKVTRMLIRDRQT